MNSIFAKEMFCPLHPTYPLQGVNLSRRDNPTLFCVFCLIEIKKNWASSDCKPFPEFLKVIADVFVQSKNSIGVVDTPQEFKDLLSSQKEKVDQMKQHIETEKERTVKYFDSLAQEATTIIFEKRNVCLKELDQQLIRLNSNFDYFNEELKKAYPNNEDLSLLFPSQETLERKFQGLNSLDQLQAFVKDLSKELYEIQQCSSLDEKQEVKRKMVQDLSKELMNLREVRPIYDIDEEKNDVSSHLKKSKDLDPPLKDSVKDLSEEPRLGSSIRNLFWNTIIKFNIV